MSTDYPPPFRGVVRPSGARLALARVIGTLRDAFDFDPFSDILDDLDTVATHLDRLETLLGEIRSVVEFDSVELDDISPALGSAFRSAVD